MIRHIVALRLRADLGEGARDALMEETGALAGIVEGVLGFRAFRNVSPEEEVVRGFLDGFWFDFRDAGARDAYLVHPAHREVAGRIVAACEGGAEGILVLDVEMG